MGEPWTERKGLWPVVFVSLHTWASVLATRELGG